MSEARDIELLYDVWEQNIETLRVLHRSANERPGIVPNMVSHLRACAVDLVKRASNGGDHPVAKGNGGARHKIDKSVLTISEPKRIRCKEHLRFVASQPCLICARVPSHAHHIRYAQSRGLSLKVSDEFTVPLCAVHHHHIHTTGKEREWWQERNIDPLVVAGRLWQQSREKTQPADAKVPDEIGRAELSGSNSKEVGSETTPGATASSNVDKGNRAHGAR
jgi:hypothetical protein